MLGSGVRPSPPLGRARSSSSGWYMVLVLTMLATVSYIDRTILNLLVDPVKRSMALSDTQISLVQGLGFSLAYILANPYIGRLSDRVNRRNLLMVAAVVWSLGTAMSAFASGFWTLMLCRMTVGAAEAAVQPSSWSMLSDRFPSERLPAMMSLFLVSPYVGGGLALIFGGALIGSAETIRAALPTVLAGLEPWRYVMLIVGLGGIAVAALLLPVREPARGNSSGGVFEEAPSVRAAVGYLYDNRGFFGNFYLAMGGIVVLLYAIPAWMPMFAARQFGTPISTLGLQFGPMVLIAGSVGVLAGPAVVRALDSRGVNGSILVAISGCALALIPCAMAIAFMQSTQSVLILGAILTLLFSLPQAIGASALQIATPSRMRGFAASIYVIVLTVTGLGLAPLAVALLTDHLFSDPRMVGASLGIVCSTAATVAAICAIRTIRPYRALLASAG